jgi:hypothetical protein
MSIRLAHRLAAAYHQSPPPPPSRAFPRLAPKLLAPAVALARRTKARGTPPAGGDKNSADEKGVWGRFHHMRGVCIGTTLRPNSALIVVVGDSANAVLTVAIASIAVAVMISRISSSDRFA